MALVVVGVVDPIKCSVSLLGVTGVSVVDITVDVEFKTVIVVGLVSGVELGGLLGGRVLGGLLGGRVLSGMVVAGDGALGGFVVAIGGFVVTGAAA